jgi:hypothetical protein
LSVESIVVLSVTADAGVPTPAVRGPRGRRRAVDVPWTLPGRLGDLRGPADAAVVTGRHSRGMTVDHPPSTRTTDGPGGTR